MTEVATSPAAAIGSTEAAIDPKPAAAGPPLVKPDKPDEAAFKAEEAKRKKALADAQLATKEAQNHVSAAKPNNADSPIAQRQQELRAELATIRTKQQEFKSSRSGTQDRLKALDTQLKAKIQEQKAARSRVPYKSAEEVDREIARLEQQVDSGKMKLVDEKKTLADITALRKQRKAFSGFDESQRSIDTLKTQITDTKKELDNPEFKSLSDRYTQITQELDALKADQDQAFKGLNANRDALTAARKHQEQCFQDLKQLQNDYHSQRRAHDEWERQVRRQQAVKKRAEREQFMQARKKREMEEELEAAGAPAFQDEIYSCDALIRLIDPASASADKSASNTSQYAAVAQRFVDDSDMKGTRLMKKDEEEENYFVGTGGKKSKKGKQGRKTDVATTTDAPSKAGDMGVYFQPGVAAHFDKIGVNQPASKEDETRVLEEIKTKKQWWQDNQAKQTEENIAAAKKRIEQMEVSAATNGTTNTTTSSSSKEDKDAPTDVQDVADGIKATSLADESKD